uniref:Pept_C1 domain-containing protein n=1 Tax=Parastrongyloides trichosuri TaxID=131310 RepID=A0A0N4Z358_PARTI
MSPVKDQKSCGGCYAFSMIGSIEAQLAIQNYTSYNLSLQQLLACDRKQHPEYKVANKGCNGGYFLVAAYYLIENAIVNEHAYPFNIEESDMCKNVKSLNSKRIKNYDAGYIKTNNLNTIKILEENMLKRLEKGPVAVGIAVHSNMYYYDKGIYDDSCGDEINHAVILIGVTDEYWLIQNSWSSEWGEKGYMKIARNETDPCQLLRYWFQPIEFKNVSSGIVTNDIKDNHKDIASNIFSSYRSKNCNKTQCSSLKCLTEED